MKYYVYILKSEKFNRRYIGLSTNVDKRLKQHNAGATKSTKPFAPWKIIHYEDFDSRVEARHREKYFKSAAGRRYINKNII